MSPVLPISKDQIRLRVLLGDIKPFPGAGLLPGAHHPHCPRHAHHLVWILGRPLCLGCTFMWPAVALGAATTGFISWSHLHWVVWGAVHAALVVPTALQPFYQAKRFKMSSRALLGLSSGSFLIGLAWCAPLGSPRWPLALALLFAFVLCARALLYLRQRKTDDPCGNCPLGVYPTCAWNLPTLLGQTADPVLREALREEGARQLGDETRSR